MPAAGLLLCGGTVFCPDAVLRRADVLIEQDTIKAVGEQLDAQEAVHVVDLAGAVSVSRSGEVLGVSGGSICDFVSLFGTSDMGWQMSEYDIGVHPSRDPVGALRRSPAGQGRPVRTPTLLLHGEADLRCPISQAEEWLALLLSSGCEAALVRYPAASHGFLTSGPPSFAADYGNRLIGWVTGHVPGGPAAQAALTQAAP